MNSVPTCNKGLLSTILRAGNGTRFCRLRFDAWANITTSTRPTDDMEGGADDLAGMDKGGSNAYQPADRRSKQQGLGKGC